MPRICQQRGGNAAPGRLTYVHSTLLVGLRAHVGATHVSKETATSICGTATGTARQLIFFPSQLRTPRSNALVIATVIQRSILLSGFKRSNSVVKRTCARYPWELMTSNWKPRRLRKVWLRDISRRISNIWLDVPPLPFVVARF